MTLTRRDLTVAIISIGATLAIYALAATPPAIMVPSVFDWNSVENRTNATGSVRKFFQGPTATLDELECHVTTLNPGMSSHPPLRHFNEEVIIIKEGTIEISHEGVVKRIGPGSVIFNATNVLHSLKNVGDTPAVYHVVSWYSPGMKPKPEAQPLVPAPATPPAKP